MRARDEENRAVECGHLVQIEAEANRAWRGHAVVVVPGAVVLMPRLKTPYRDGTTDVVFEPLDFMARLAALVPSPRVNLTRYHGVFAPNHRLREQVTPARRGRRSAETTDEPAPAPHVSMTWAQRLKRVFKIDILTCEHCGGPVKVIASIEDEPPRESRRLWVLGQAAFR